MKIAYISTSTVPSLTANSLHVMKMCQALVQEGHDTTLYAIRGAGDADAAIQQRYGIAEGFPIVWLKLRPHLRGYDAAAAGVLAARRRSAELIYTRSTAAAALASQFGIPTILELHDLPGGQFGPHLLRRFFGGEGCIRLVVISAALQRDLQVQFPELPLAQRCIVAHDAVDMERFHHLPRVPTARAAIGVPEQFTAGYAGSFYSGKGIELIVRLAPLMPHVRFLLMGGDAATIAGIKADLSFGATTNIAFAGFVDNARLPVYLAACDILLMPYQRKVAGSGGGNVAKYMSPLKLFEYMAAERLIIASDLPVLREVLTADNSVLCPPDDPAMWEQAIRQAIDDVEWRETHARNARRDVESHTWRRRVQLCLAADLETRARSV